MPEFGVTRAGFLVKPLADILADKAARAQEVFGQDIDLRSTSSLRKILDVAAAEDHELWKGMERAFYATFLSTADGEALDLLGEDLGISRRLLPAKGEVKLTLKSGAPGRLYHLPIGTLVETGPPVRHYRTLARVSLSNDQKEATVAIEALERGRAGNVAAGDIDKINALYAIRYLNLGAATVQVANEADTAGGELTEDDGSYRALLLGSPRTVWTLEVVRRAVTKVDGVRDCRLFDPLGGVDVSVSKFKLFLFSQRRFGTQRLLGSPYFFDVLVAVYPGFPWETLGSVEGVRDAVARAIGLVRPISIFPNLRLANTVFVGIRGKIVIKSGHDPNAVAAAIKGKLEGRVNALGLGNAVVYAEVMRGCMEVAGVIDVQQLHLRRCPPRLATITFGRSQKLEAEPIEMAIGENLPLQPDEIPVVEVNSPLLDLEVSDR